MSTQVSSKKNKRPPKKHHSSQNGTAQPPDDGGERTVKKLRLSKALTIPDGTTVSEACRRMAARRIDAVLLTDSNALLSGIITDKDVATRVVAEGLRPEETTVSKVMTRNPIFVTSDTLAIEALQKMVQGKFRHLPVVENGEVIAMLDITKCLYDAISRMEKAAQQGSAVAAAVEGVELQQASNVSVFLSAPNTFIETLRERMFKPSLSTIVGEKTKAAISSISDPVYVAAKRMRELQVNSAVIVMENKIHGILTSKDILMRVVAQNLSPESVLVEKVMTPNPECASLETTILEALHLMHDGKFLHLPVVDRDGNVAACVDVLEITHAAISLVESSSGTVNDPTNTVMQKFWDSAFSLEPPEDCDTHSEVSGLLTFDGADTTKSTYQSVGFGNSFVYKFEDQNGRVHRFFSGAEHQDDLVSTVMQKIGHVNDGERPTLLYEDDDGDKIIIATDNDLAAAVSYARSAGLKALKLDLEFANSSKPTKPQSDTANVQQTSIFSRRSGIFAGAVVLTSIGIMVYLKRSK
ncbi:CBS domain-containing protein CBSCBSPB3-like isoform X2 [Abrus precatorius]|uniref:CBS domain-containing protein CBSCBSPB3-like isoform X2 n=1 Tax=Abrus precatorius TaxID=3816 RepID=A0A8B8K7V3_ABRPR|nr:CBS domain-containing protein CBSCBSPB3-like isoform X2 [Abrus precatorius]